MIISEFKGRNYNLTVAKNKDGTYVSDGNKKRYFKNEFRAIEWCEGYIEAVGRVDYAIQIPLHMAYLRNCIDHEAKEGNATVQDIILKALNKFFKRK